MEQNEALPKLIVIGGTNATGKSGLAVELAKRFNGEIVSADSRQVFKGYDLGSGKITRDEMQGVPHHLLDVCDSGDFFSVHDFQKLAYVAIDDILSRWKIPFLVGGTGLYVASVSEGYVMSDRMPDLNYRAELEAHSTEELREMLLKVLPDIVIDQNNRNRMMRVLEKLHDGDDVQPTSRPRYDCLKLGVSWPREILKQRIDERLDRRFAQGMVEEVKALLDEGTSVPFMLKLGLEYKYITQYIIGDYACFEDMKEELARAIKRFAKRQMIWFRRDKAFRWLDMAGNPFDEASELIQAFLNA